MKKKKILFLIGLLAIIAVLGLNIKLNSISLKADLNLNALYNTAKADGEDVGIGINLEDHTCVCNDAVCQDANMLSFRKQCAYIYPSRATDANCKIADLEKDRDCY